MSGGEEVGDGLEPIFNVPIRSLYGKKRKPAPEDLQDLDALLFDMQDAGARFYTYASTLTFVMEAAADEGLEVILLDRPNPLGGVVVDGEIMEDRFRSFVGMHPIPVQHGMTLGELALMINGSGWLAREENCARLTVVPCASWTREMTFSEVGWKWLPPSPNLPDFETVLVYPGLCFLEGTNVSEGRGTDEPFLTFGAPWMESEKILEELKKHAIAGFDFEPRSFTPCSRPGAKNPKFENRLCHGIRILPQGRRPPKAGCFWEFRFWTLFIAFIPISFASSQSRYIDRLYGSDGLRKTVQKGKGIDRIVKKWRPRIKGVQRLPGAFPYLRA